MSLLETLLGPTRKLPALSMVPEQLSQLLFSDLGIRECAWKGTSQLIAISSSLGSEDSTAERVKGLVHSEIEPAWVSGLSCRASSQQTALYPCYNRKNTSIY